MDTSNIHNNTDWLNYILNKIAEYGLIIGVLLFSLVAKFYTIRAYKKRMKPFDCVVESIMCGMGSSLVIYVLLLMKVNTVVFCFVGGFSSLFVTPLTTVLSREAMPIIYLVINGVKSFIKAFIKKKTESL